MAGSPAYLILVGWGLLFTLMLVTIAARADGVACATDEKTGDVYAVKGSIINIRQGPGTEFERVIDIEASEKLGTTEYAKVSKGHIVRVNCRQGNWSQINVLSPDWLRKSHRGWVMSRFISRTALRMPTKIDRATIEWPMLNSEKPGMDAMGAMLR